MESYSDLTLVSRALWFGLHDVTLTINCVTSHNPHFPKLLDTTNGSLFATVKNMTYV